jgi:gliding motility-associated lipoprotein GldH
MKMGRPHLILNKTRLLLGIQTFQKIMKTWNFLIRNSPTPKGKREESQKTGRLLQPPRGKRCINLLKPIKQTTQINLVKNHGIQKTREITEETTRINPKTKILVKTSIYPKTPIPKANLPTGTTEEENPTGIKDHKAGTAKETTKMKVKLLKPIMAAIFAITAWLGACNSDRVFEEFTGFSSLSWALVDTVSFKINEVDTLNTRSLIGIRYNKDYEFHNLYVRYQLKDSLGRVQQDSLINISLFDSRTGKPLGKGFGNRLTLYDTLPLDQVPQKSRIDFFQYMRKDTLNGLEAVGLKIVRQN